MIRRDVGCSSFPVLGGCLEDGCGVAWQWSLVAWGWVVVVPLEVYLEA